MLDILYHLTSYTN